MTSTRIPSSSIRPVPHLPLGGHTYAEEFRVSGNSHLWLLMLLDPNSTKIYQSICSESIAYPPDDPVRIAFSKAYGTILKIGIAWVVCRRNNNPEMTDQEFNLFPNATEAWKAFTTFMPFLNSHDLLERFEYFHETHSFINENDYLQFSNLLKNVTRSAESWKIITSKTDAENNKHEVTFNKKKLEMYLAYQDGYANSTNASARRS